MLRGDGAFGVGNRVCSSNFIFFERDRRPTVFFFLFSFLALNSSRSSHFAFFFLHWCLGHGWVGLD